MVLVIILELFIKKLPAYNQFHLNILIFELEKIEKKIEIELRNFMINRVHVAADTA